MTPTAARTTIASAYERSGVEVMPATRMVPAIAAPRDEPRLDTLRDRPGDLALQVLGEARLHDVDRRGQHHAEPQSDQEQSRREGPDARGAAHQGEQDADAGDA